MDTPAALAVSRTLARIRTRCSTGKPSSMIIASVRYIGLAPDTARSLTVPATATFPMSPLPKNSGSTTNESVVTAMRPVVTGTSALSSICPM
jgi:hypothetical protein